MRFCIIFFSFCSLDVPCVILVAHYMFNLLPVLEIFFLKHFLFFFFFGMHNFSEEHVINFSAGRAGSLGFKEFNVLWQGRMCT